MKLDQFKIPSIEELNEISEESKKELKIMELQSIIIKMKEAAKYTNGRCDVRILYSENIQILENNRYKVIEIPIYNKFYRILW